jgi:Spy/CpxP family protein refolding chaperone
MKRTSKIALALGTALSLGLGVAAVNAHPYGMDWDDCPGAGPGYGMHGYGMGPGWGMHGYGMGPQGMFVPGTAEERLAGLKSELGITAKQEAAWQAFVKSAKQRDESRQAWFAKMREARAAGSLPELLAQRDEVFKQHQAERQAMTSALKDLYAALTPEQKTIADQRLGGFGPGYGAGYGRGYGGGPGARFR